LEVDFFMVTTSEKIKKAAQRRKYHVRKKVFGTPDRPRLSVFRSNRHIYTQITDDVAGATLVSASTRTKALRDQLPRGGDKKAAQIVGEAVAKQALGVGIKCVCFDRNRYKFHGRVKALAEAAKKAGLVF
jgi:large subunit ribosomal protein L18